MIAKFEKQIAILTERNITMGIEEFLLDQAEKKGRIEGIEEGIVKGIEKNNRETAIKMKKSGLESSLIANITGLSIEEIEKL
jgi:predicted transposase/invertase (TIGR01784 family)